MVHLLQIPHKFVDPKGGPAFYLHYRKCGVIEKDEETLIALTQEALAKMEEMLV